jgi:hypothetical protein
MQDLKKIICSPLHKKVEDPCIKAYNMLYIYDVGLIFFFFLILDGLLPKGHVCLSIKVGKHWSLN